MNIYIIENDDRLGIFGSFTGGERGKDVDELDGHCPACGADLIIEWHWLRSDEGNVYDCGHYREDTGERCINCGYHREYDEED